MFAAFFDEPGGQFLQRHFSNLIKIINFIDQPRRRRAEVVRKHLALAMSGTEKNTQEANQMRQTRQKSDISAPRTYSRLQTRAEARERKQLTHDDHEAQGEKLDEIMRLRTRLTPRRC